MTILQTLGVFVGIPAVLYALISLLSQLPGRGRRHPRYRPGQSWDFAPQWWRGDTPIQRAEVLPGAEPGGARGQW